MPTLYAKHVPTTDAATLQYYPEKQRAKLMDVAIYYDKEETQHAATYSWWRDSKPKRTRKTLTHNCFKYRLQWL
jgi:hypothetical protein